ncbi:MAG TPA: acyl-CoA dehydrogenase [Spirochaetota bacterium]|nr:acyl-CoA dehydrogenase [Spirochaetota bacterium]
MAQKFYSETNLKFIVNDVHELESLSKYPKFEGYDEDSINMILDTAKGIAKDHMFPYFSEMDKNQPVYTGSTIKVHPFVRNFMKIMAEGGWITAPFPVEHGGQNMPMSAFIASSFILSAANYSQSVYPGLTTGALGLIFNYAAKELQDIFTPQMISGAWQGTMALTEPEAGSSLGDVKTKAVPTGKGYYLVRGQKTFISAGDHDGVDNIVHLMLARIEGAPAGVKGLSLFIVPKHRPGDNNTLVFNDVNCAGCYHKMGYRGAPIAQLSMGESDDCHGYLVGEENKGLSYMFHMMNEARINVGLGAAAISSAAYNAALEYTRERQQGRKITEKDSAKPQIAIIEHTDIKRMLLKQRAIVEGSLSLIIYTGKLVDLMSVTEGAEREHYELLLDILTPVVKTYPSEMGIISTSQAIQCMGGYGYTDDFTAEQYMRDVRIHPIHEGTTGIQGMDLLGRKVTMKGGAAVKAYISEMQKTVQEAGEFPELTGYAESLTGAVQLWQGVIGELVQFAMKGEIDRFLADSTIFLELTGIICIAWQWLIQGIEIRKQLQNKTSRYSSEFMEGKMITLKYFYLYELPGVFALERILRNSGGFTAAVDPIYFED